MEKPQVTAYLKTQCGWSRGVRAVLDKYELPYEEKNIQEDPQNYLEMVRVTGQQLSPCVSINGTMLPDVSGDEVEEYLLTNNLVQDSSADAGVPTDRGCDDHAPVGEPLNFTATR